MGTTRNFITGLGAGAGLMYLMDPARGRRRRALIRDRFSSIFSQSGHEFDKAWRDAVNRSHGLTAAARNLAYGAEETLDDVLAARVRAKLGRVCSHPHAIQVTAREGVITLEGPILAAEVQGVLDAANEVQGVQEIQNRLEPHERGEDVPALQGGTPRTGHVPELAQLRWTPAWRAVATFAGTYLLARGLRRRGFFGGASSLAGAGLLTRALANMPLSDLVGAGEACAINVQKTLNINAPPERVYSFWDNYSNFARFMTHLKEVRDLGNGRSHWVAEGPGGTAVSWDAEVVEKVPNQLISWRSLPGSQIDNWGSVRFDPNRDGGTRVTVRMCYAPPAGMLGHVVASLFRRDPRHEMDDDMARLKSLIEYGKTRAHGETIHREELGAPGM